MFITKYHIKKIHTGHLLDVPEWSINMTIEPSWVGHIFLNECFPKTVTIQGSANNWKWSDGRSVGMLWRWWAFAVMAKHDKSKEEATYVNCRITQSTN